MMSPTLLSAQPAKQSMVVLSDALPWVLLSVQKDDQSIRTAFQSPPPKRLSAPLFSLPSSRALVSYDKISKDREKLPELHSWQQQSEHGQNFLY